MSTSIYCLARSVISVFIITVLAASSVNTDAIKELARTKPANQSASTYDSSKQINSFKSRASARAVSWAELQIRRMSLDERIGQLISIGINGRFLNQDSDAFRALRHQVKDNHIGGIVLFRGSVYESVHLVNRMQRLSRYPLLVSADMEFGAGMRFDDTESLPWNMAVGATGNTQYAIRQGEIIAQEARALGIKQIFGPVVDVNNNPANPIINVRSYSEDPLEVARLSAAFINGAQRNGVMATAKHFPGHGDTAIDSHRGLPVINANRDRLELIELVPYRAAIAAGVGSVMASYIALPEIDPTVINPLSADRSTQPSTLIQGGEITTEKATLPAALSPVLLKGLLRDELHFDGLIVTDALDMSGLTIYFNQDEAAVRAIEAGADMLIKPSDADAVLRGLHQAVMSGRITEARINHSARRILAAKFDLGLVQRRDTPIEKIDNLLSDAKVTSFAREVAEHAITLVRNDADLVPIKLAPNRKIFNLAITNGDDRLFITMPFVAEMARKEMRVDTAVLDDRSSEDEIREAVKRAQEADCVIVSLYGRVRAGESRSVGLPEAAGRALTELINQNAPLIVISFGNPYLLQNFPRVRTYIVAYGDMPSLQEAAASAVLGKIDISGKLPISLPSLYPRGTGIQLKAIVNGPSQNTSQAH